MNLMKKKRVCIIVSCVCTFLVVFSELYGFIYLGTLSINITQNSTLDWKGRDYNTNHMSTDDVVNKTSMNRDRFSQYYGLQMNLDQFKNISKVPAEERNVLIWAIWDGSLWQNSTDEKVIFIQDDSFSQQTEQRLNDKTIKIPRTYRVHYKTYSFKSLLNYLNKPETWHELDLSDQLPDFIKQTHWHVIIVPSSFECCGAGQGRYQAIYTSWKLAQINTHIIVDDFQCSIEQEFSINILGKPHEVIKGNSKNEQAHFIVNSTNSFKPSTVKPSLDFGIKSGDNKSSIYSMISDSNQTKVLDNTNNVTFNWSVVVAVNNGYFDFFNNWRLHFIKLNISLPVYVIAEDNSVYDKLLNIKDSGIKVQRSEYISINSSVKYKSKSFRQMMSARPFYILSFLQKGIDIIFSDLDTVWLKNPLPYFTGDFDIWIQFNTDQLNVYCSGFMAIKSNKDTYSFIKKWRDALKVKPMLNQPAFNQLVKQSQIKIKGLESKHFPSGRLYFEKFSREERAGVVVVHNNWIIGHDNKLERFKNMNLWLNETTT